MPRNKDEAHDELSPELIVEHKKLNEFHAATESKTPYHEFLVNFPLQSAVILRTGTLAKQLEDAKELAAQQQAANPKGPRRTGGIDRKPSDGTRYAAIVEAVRSGAVDELTSLISAGVTVDSRSSSSRTALMYSIMEQRAECVKLLLDAGADVRAVDAGGMSVLHWAALYGDVDLVKLLMSKGAEAWALNISKMRPHEVMTSNDSRAASSLVHVALTKSIIKKQVSIVEAYLEAIYNKGRGLNRSSLAVNFASKGRSFSPGTLILVESCK
jgi:ankyrin repeat protein